MPASSIPFSSSIVIVWATSPPPASHGWSSVTMRTQFTGARRNVITRSPGAVSDIVCGLSTRAGLPDAGL